MAWDDTEKELVEKTGDDACKDYTEVVSSNEAVTWEGGSEGKWFVVKGDAAISEHITVTGTVTAAMVQTLMGVDKPMTTTAKSPVSIKIPVAVYRRYFTDVAAKDVQGIVEEALDRYFEGKGAQRREKTVHTAVRYIWKHDRFQMNGRKPVKRR